MYFVGKNIKFWESTCILNKFIAITLTEKYFLKIEIK